MVEGLGLGLAALLLGLPLSSALLRLFTEWLAPDTMRDLLRGVHATSWPVLMAAAALAAFASVLASLVPAVRVARTVSAETLQRLNFAGSGGAARSRRWFVVAQTALAVTLLITVGLLLQSRQTLGATPTGLNLEDAFFAKLEPQRLGYDAPRARELARHLSDILVLTPDVSEFTLARQAPLQSNGWVHQVSRSMAGPAAAEMVGYDVVSSTYFDFYDITSIDGRLFMPGDTGQTALVAVVNETLARTWWPDERAVGAEIRLAGEASARTVVGVVKDVKYNSLRQASRPYLYLPLSQQYPLPQVELTVHVRPRFDAQRAEAAVTRAVADLDPDLPLFGFGRVEQQIARELALPTLVVGFVSIAAFIALILVCLGLNGAMLQTIGQMQREMAIRLALGARHSHLRIALARRVLASVGLGVVLGFAAGVLVRAGLAPLLMAPELGDTTLVALVLLPIAASAGLATAGQIWKIGRLQPGQVLHEC